VSNVCREGHPLTLRGSGGKRICRVCERARARDTHRLLGDAARHLGLTLDAYRAEHGGSRATAEAVLAGPAAPPQPETCPNGHRRTSANTGWKRSHGRTHRFCIDCRRIRDRRAWDVIAVAAERHGMSASEWIRRHGGNYSTAAVAAGMEPAVEVRHRKPDNWSRNERARQARAATRARAAATATHVAHLDPEPSTWDGLSILALCSCGWRETHATPDRARAALHAHTAERPDSAYVRGDRLDHWQETA
jgi:hypothetical protein